MRTSATREVVRASYRVEEAIRLRSVPSPPENDRLSWADRQTVRCAGDDTELEHHNRHRADFERRRQPLSRQPRLSVMQVSGTYTQSGAGAFDVDLGGTTAGTQYDVLNITSTATLGGVLNVDLISGFKPAVGETFDIMDYT